MADNVNEDELDDQHQVNFNMENVSSAGAPEAEKEKVAMGLALLDMVRQFRRNAEKGNLVMVEGVVQFRKDRKGRALESSAMYNYNPETKQLSVTEAGQAYIRQLVGRGQEYSMFVKLLETLHVRTFDKSPEGEKIGRSTYTIGEDAKDGLMVKLISESDQKKTDQRDSTYGFYMDIIALDWLLENDRDNAGRFKVRTESLSTIASNKDTLRLFNRVSGYSAEDAIKLLRERDEAYYDAAMNGRWYGMSGSNTAYQEEWKKKGQGMFIMNPLVLARSDWAYRSGTMGSQAMVDGINADGDFSAITHMHRTRDHMYRQMARDALESQDEAARMGSQNLILVSSLKAVRDIVDELQRGYREPRVAEILADTALLENLFAQEMGATFEEWIQAESPSEQEKAEKLQEIAVKAAEKDTVLFDSVLLEGLFEEMNGKSIQEWIEEDEPSDTDKEEMMDKIARQAALKTGVLEYMRRADGSFIRDKEGYKVIKRNPFKNIIVQLDTDTNPEIDPALQLLGGYEGAQIVSNTIERGYDIKVNKEKDFDKMLAYIFTQIPFPDKRVRNDLRDLSTAKIMEILKDTSLDAAAKMSKLSQLLTVDGEAAKLLDIDGEEADEAAQAMVYRVVSEMLRGIIRTKEDKPVLEEVSEADMAEYLAQKNEDISPATVKAYLDGENVDALDKKVKETLDKAKSAVISQRKILLKAVMGGTAGDTLSEELFGKGVQSVEGVETTYENKLRALLLDSTQYEVITAEEATPEQRAVAIQELQAKLHRMLQTSPNKAAVIKALKGLMTTQNKDLYEKIWEVIDVRNMVREEMNIAMVQGRESIEANTEIPEADRADIIDRFMRAQKAMNTVLFGLNVLMENQSSVARLIQGTGRGSRFDNIGGKKLYENLSDGGNLLRVLNQGLMFEPGHRGRNQEDQETLVHARKTIQMNELLMKLRAGEMLEPDEQDALKELSSIQGVEYASLSTDYLRMTPEELQSKLDTAIEHNTALLLGWYNRARKNIEEFQTAEREAISQARNIKTWAEWGAYEFRAGLLGRLSDSESGALEDLVGKIVTGLIQKNGQQPEVLAKSLTNVFGVEFTSLTGQADQAEAIVTDVMAYMSEAVRESLINEVKSRTKDMVGEFDKALNSEQGKYVSLSMHPDAKKDGVESKQDHEGYKKFAEDKLQELTDEAKVAEQLAEHFMNNYSLPASETFEAEAAEAFDARSLEEQKQQLAGKWSGNWQAAHNAYLAQRREALLKAQEEAEAAVEAEAGKVLTLSDYAVGLGATVRSRVEEVLEEQVEATSVVNQPQTPLVNRAAQEEQETYEEQLARRVLESGRAQVDLATRKVTKKTAEQVAEESRAAVEAQAAAAVETKVPGLEELAEAAAAFTPLESGRIDQTIGLPVGAASPDKKLRAVSDVRFDISAEAADALAASGDRVRTQLLEALPKGQGALSVEVDGVRHNFVFGKNADGVIQVVDSPQMDVALLTQELNAAQQSGKPAELVFGEAGRVNAIIGDPAMISDEVKASMGTGNIVIDAELDAGTVGDGNLLRRVRSSDAVIGNNARIEDVAAQQRLLAGNGANLKQVTAQALTAGANAEVQMVSAGKLPRDVSGMLDVADNELRVGMYRSGEYLERSIPDVAKLQEAIALKDGAIVVYETTEEKVAKAKGTWVDRIKTGLRESKGRIKGLGDKLRLSSEERSPEQIAKDRALEKELQQSIADDIARSGIGLVQETPEKILADLRAAGYITAEEAETLAVETETMPEAAGRVTELSVDGRGAALSEAFNGLQSVVTQVAEYRTMPYPDIVAGEDEKAGIVNAQRLAKMARIKTLLFSYRDALKKMRDLGVDLPAEHPDALLFKELAEEYLVLYGENAKIAGGVLEVYAPMLSLIDEYLMYQGALYDADKAEEFFAGLSAEEREQTVREIATQTMPELLEKIKEEASKAKTPFTMQMLDQVGMLPDTVEAGWPANMMSAEVQKFLSDNKIDLGMIAEQDDLTAAQAGSIVTLNGTEYLVTQYLGEGGFATAWLAYEVERDENGNPVLGRRSVVKTSKMRGEKFDTMFREEAELLNSIDLAGRVPTLVDHGPGFIVMDWMRGENFDNAHGTIQFQGGAETLDDVRKITEYARGMFKAVGELHRTGVNHRDLKPENIVYDPVSGEMKLIDLGLSRRHDALRNELIISLSPLYSEPERTQSEARLNEDGTPMLDKDGNQVMIYGLGEVPQQSDYFPIGVMLFEMINGYNPYAKYADTQHEPGSDAWIRLLANKRLGEDDAASWLQSRVDEAKKWWTTRKDPKAALIQEMNSLALQLMNRDPLKRGSSTEILSKLAEIQSRILALQAAEGIRPAAQQEIPSEVAQLLAEWNDAGVDLAAYWRDSWEEGALESLVQQRLRDMAADYDENRTTRKAAALQSYIGKYVLSLGFAVPQELRQQLAEQGIRVTAEISEGEGITIANNLAARARDAEEDALAAETEEEKAALEVKAAALWAAALKADPQNAAALHRKAAEAMARASEEGIAAGMKQGYEAKAAAYLKIAYATDSTDAEIAEAYVDALLKTGKESQAIEVAKEYRDAVRRADADRLYGLTLAKAGRQAEALAWFRKISKGRTTRAMRRMLDRYAATAEATGRIAELQQKMQGLAQQMRFAQAVPDKAEEIKAQIKELQDEMKQQQEIADGYTLTMDHLLSIDVIFEADAEVIAEVLKPVMGEVNAAEYRKLAAAARSEALNGLMTDKINVADLNLAEEKTEGQYVAALLLAVYEQKEKAGAFGEGERVKLLAQAHEADPENMQAAELLGKQYEAAGREEAAKAAPSDEALTRDLAAEAEQVRQAAKDAMERYAQLETAMKKLESAYKARDRQVELEEALEELSGVLKDIGMDVPLIATGADYGEYLTARYNSLMSLVAPASMHARRAAMAAQQKADALTEEVTPAQVEKARDNAIEAAFSSSEQYGPMIQYYTAAYKNGSRDAGVLQELTRHYERAGRELQSTDAAKKAAAEEATWQLGALYLLQNKHEQSYRAYGTMAAQDRNRAADGQISVYESLVSAQPHDMKNVFAWMHEIFKLENTKETPDIDKLGETLDKMEAAVETPGGRGRRRHSQQLGT